MLMRTDPFREIDRLAEQFFGTTARPAVMHLDAYRDGDYFYAAFDLPGVDPDSIDCTVERNVLTVRAERRRPTGDKVELIAAERPMGTFTRQLFLSDTLDTDKLEAGYDNGVLTLRIPIADRAKPRRISVTTTANGNGRKQISA
ncbi:Hsp20/alpha crystallin family protein [Micromonospora sp. DR5-3]|uniref:Hsp20/alpha crystallin family protein n=1 Tax=unclassified Micromonospora TaxID=2617518 RepID=UPI0011D51E39|nr:MULTISPECIES: Hsp20/alpha crystallin family protein [unclassified Micromonospora]MCW3818228.1 Hsp20/alpha crystallin family protein [Micromonospora sp. DR5-3]TYC21676.1 Hsp20/alpha crystallin family protein [Micromonospora sp. MP36]